MVRIGGVLALLGSLILALALSSRIRSERYAGPVEFFKPDWFVFELLEHPEPLVIGGLSLRELPPTVPAHLEARLRGIKSREWIGFELTAPEELHGRAVRRAPAEFRHEWLELPFGGLVRGRTIVRVGDAEWGEGPWRVWGAIAGIALLPLAIWTLASIPFLLLGKRARPQA